MVVRVRVHSRAVICFMGSNQLKSGGSVLLGIAQLLIVLRYAGLVATFGGNVCVKPCSLSVQVPFQRS